jgi:zinc protease
MPNAYRLAQKANIDTAHYSMLTSFYKDWYRPDLQAVIVVGDVDVRKQKE